MGWQWHQLDHIAPCSRQITMPTPHLSIFYRPDALTNAQSTVSKHWKQSHVLSIQKKLKIVLQTYHVSHFIISCACWQVMSTWHKNSVPCTLHIPQWRTWYSNTCWNIPTGHAPDKITTSMLYRTSLENAGILLISCTNFTSKANGAVIDVIPDDCSAARQTQAAECRLPQRILTHNLQQCALNSTSFHADCESWPCPQTRAVPNTGFSVFGRIPNSSLQYSAEYE